MECKNVTSFVLSMAFLWIEGLTGGKKRRWRRSYLGSDEKFRSCSDENFRSLGHSTYYSNKNFIFSLKRIIS